MICEKKFNYNALFNKIIKKDHDEQTIKMKIFCSFFTMRMKLLPCLNDSFYEDKTIIPRPINTCLDGHINIYCYKNKEWFQENVFGRHQVCIQ